MRSFVKNQKEWYKPRVTIPAPSPCKGDVIPLDQACIVHVNFSTTIYIKCIVHKSRREQSPGKSILAYPVQYEYLLLLKCINSAAALMVLLGDGQENGSSRPRRHLN